MITYTNNFLINTVKNTFYKKYMRFHFWFKVNRTYELKIQLNPKYYKIIINKVISSLYFLGL